jgi:hypothetical protein
MSIRYLNAQSIVKKIDELCCLANLIKPDLILVTIGGHKIVISLTVTFDH